MADRIAGVILAAIAVVAALLLTGCPTMQEAYATYDQQFERELVAGHDSVRGDYVEYRVKPRPRSLATIATSAASDGRNADAAGTAGKTVVPAQGGKAVLR